MVDAYCFANQQNTTRSERKMKNAHIAVLALASLQQIGKLAQEREHDEFARLARRLRANSALLSRLSSTEEQREELYNYEKLCSPLLFQLHGKRGDDEMAKVIHASRHMDLNELLSGRSKNIAQRLKNTAADEKVREMYYNWKF